MNNNDLTRNPFLVSNTIGAMRQDRVVNGPEGGSNGRLQHHILDQQPPLALIDRTWQRAPPPILGRAQVRQNRFRSRHKSTSRTPRPRRWNRDSGTPRILKITTRSARGGGRPVERERADLSERLGLSAKKCA